MEMQNTMENIKNNKKFSEACPSKSSFSVSSLLSAEYYTYRKNSPEFYRNEACIPVNPFSMPCISRCFCHENQIGISKNHQHVPNEQSKNKHTLKDQKEGQSELLSSKPEYWPKSEFNWFNRLSLCESPNANFMLPSQLQLARFGSVPNFPTTVRSLHSEWISYIPFAAANYMTSGKVSSISKY